MTHETTMIISTYLREYVRHLELDEDARTGETIDIQRDDGAGNVITFHIDTAGDKTVSRMLVANLIDEPVAESAAESRVEGDWCCTDGVDEWILHVLLSEDDGFRYHTYLEARTDGSPWLIVRNASGRAQAFHDRNEAMRQFAEETSEDNPIFVSRLIDDKGFSEVRLTLLDENGEAIAESTWPR